MWTWKTLASVLVVALPIIACGSAAKGESCSDEGRINGDCDKALMCVRTKADDSSPLICLKPCVEQGDCEASEVCTGDRGRNLQACRPR